MFLVRIVLMSMLLGAVYGMYRVSSSQSFSYLRYMYRRRRSSCTPLSIHSASENDQARRLCGGKCWIGVWAFGGFSWVDGSRDTFRPSCCLTSGQSCYAITTSGSWVPTGCRDKLFYLCRSPATPRPTPTPTITITQVVTTSTTTQAVTTSRTTLTLPGSEARPCIFTMGTTMMTHREAKRYCRSELGEYQELVEPRTIQELNDAANACPENRCWLGGVAGRNSYKWESDNRRIEPSDPLWVDSPPLFFRDNCVFLLGFISTNRTGWAPANCGNSFYPLCTCPRTTRISRCGGNTPDGYCTAPPRNVVQLRLRLTSRSSVTCAQLGVGICSNRIYQFFSRLYRPRPGRNRSTTCFEVICYERDRRRLIAHDSVAIGLNLAGNTTSDLNSTVVSVLSSLDATQLDGYIRETRPTLPPLNVANMTLVPVRNDTPVDVHDYDALLLKNEHKSTTTTKYSTKTPVQPVPSTTQTTSATNALKVLWLAMVVVFMLAL